MIVMISKEYQEYIWQFYSFIRKKRLSNINYFAWLKTNI